MIATKFCDVCDRELPPMAFQSSYECADMSLHPNHPWHKSGAVRLSATPHFTNGDPMRRPDLCPACFLKLCEAVVTRLKKRNAREAGKLKEWSAWRAASRRDEEVREGANQQRKPAATQ